MSSSTTSNNESVDNTNIALSLRDVGVSYGRESALENVNGEVHAGGSLALIGPNGAGKTTLIRSILGLVQLSGGEIEVLGRSPVDARQDVAYVPQADNLDREFPVSVLDVVLMGRYRKIGWFKRVGKEDKALALEALREVDLEDRARSRFGVLSGGQRQRVLLARAIAQQAKLLLLDEPFNGVDTTTTDVILKVLDRLRSEGAAIVMSTHDLAMAHLACSHACLVNHHQFGFGSVDSTLTPELLRKTYGGRAVVLSGDSTVVTT